MRLTDQEKFEVFGEFDPTAFEAEVEERWGDKASYAESRRRTSRYSKDDWTAIKAENEAIMRRLADALQRGVDPESAEAAALVEEHREHIDRWYYPCTQQMHGALAEMWLSDGRFRASIDAHAPGLADFMEAAAVATAAPE